MHRSRLIAANSLRQSATSPVVARPTSETADVESADVDPTAAMLGPFASRKAEAGVPPGGHH